MSIKLNDMSEVNTLFVGQVRHHHDTCTSTNALAIEEIAKRTPVEGTAITAGYQTLGRGRHDRFWQSSAKQNLLVSFILRPTFLAATEQWLLNVMATVAIADVLALHNIECECRWPNDVLIKGQKISGILFQNGIGKQKLKFAICGIGLNVRQLNWSSDVEAATSLLKEGVDISVDEVFAQLSRTLEHRYLAIKANRLDAVIQSYNALLNTSTRVFVTQSNNDRISGFLQHVTTTGQLHLSIDNQSSLSINLRDVGDVTHRES